MEAEFSQQLLLCPFWSWTWLTAKRVVELKRSGLGFHPLPGQAKLFQCSLPPSPMVSLCSPGCPETHSVDQTGLELRNHLASARIKDVRDITTHVSNSFLTAKDYPRICQLFKNLYQLLLPTKFLTCYICFHLLKCSIILRQWIPHGTCFLETLSATHDCIPQTTTSSSAPLSFL